VQKIARDFLDTLSSENQAQNLKTNIDSIPDKKLS
jgi:hypothetical protein